MKNVLVVVDMQKDFVNGSLGTPEAQAIVNGVAEKIKGFSGHIFVTYDTHFEDYLTTPEGKKLPVEHCIKGNEGFELNNQVENALKDKEYEKVEKLTFGSTKLPKLIKDRVGDEEFSIELVGLCTDICVVSNALILKANFPDVSISVDASCCAGVTPESHNAALKVMQMCQIDVK